MNFKQLCCTVIITMAATSAAIADDFASLNTAYPTFNTPNLEPVFDFDGDGCLPSAGYSQAGVKNGGNNTSGSLGGGCRHSSFMTHSNTYHRHTCKVSGGHTYCGHMYALYFKKDQIIPSWTCPLTTATAVICAIGNGHRHDWEYVVVFTKDDVITHGAASHHSTVHKKSVNDIPKENGHLKFVYHKTSNTHAMRFANNNETAENPTGNWVTPPLVSWYYMKGNSPSVNNAALRNKFDNDWTGDAKPHIRDNDTTNPTSNYFLTKLNQARPTGYPTF